MPLEPGTTLGPYSVTAKIGEGGMGEVYRARDTTLDRDVALKVLPDAFTADTDRLARFEREAKVLASFNHPNIAAIYGLEEAGDTRALVLELVEGPTLADRIKQGPIPLDEALPIAKQIAEALEAAHEAGVIHRDLKPANIKVREDGTVKVLDFGLAKALDPNPEGDPSQSPTLTAAATQMGVIMGTAAYMSPEQARGKPVDKRTDIWAFGAVLYEMLSGKRAFEGEDVSVTLADVIRAEPAWERLPESLSSSLQTYLRRCLEKDPTQRVQAIGDVRLAIEGAFETRGHYPSEVIDTPEFKTWQRPVPAAALAVMLLAAGGGVVWSLARPEPPGLVRFSISPDQIPELHISPQTRDAVISPDGRRLAYLTGVAGVRGRELHSRALDQLTSVVLVSGGQLTNPFFSPDSQSVAFQQGTEIKRISVGGGPIATICELPGGNLRGASWGDDGNIIFGVSDPTGLWRVPAVGGAPQQLTTPGSEREEVNHYWPQALPNGRAVLYTSLTDPPEHSQVGVLSLDNMEQTMLVRGTHPVYSPTGHLLYGDSATLWAVGFDLSSLETRGDPVPVQEGVWTKAFGAVNFSVSDDGSLVYVPGGAQESVARTLVWVDREGREEPLLAPPAAYESPRISPDGRHVALEVNDPQNTDIMVYDLQRETFMRLTFDPAGDRSPAWNLDGRRILFSLTRDGAGNIYSKAASGAGDVERLTTSDNFQSPQSWSSDGQTLLIREVVEGRSTVRTLSLGDQAGSKGLAPAEFADKFPDVYPAVSPDGRWLAYMSDESGEFEIYVRPFPNVEDGRWQVSNSGGVSPVWARDGGKLFYRVPGSFEMMAVEVEAGSAFSHGSPAMLFRAPYRVGAPGRNRPGTWRKTGAF